MEPLSAERYKRCRHPREASELLQSLTDTTLPVQLKETGFINFSEM